MVAKRTGGKPQPPTGETNLRHMDYTKCHSFWPATGATKPQAGHVVILLQKPACKTSANKNQTQRGSCAASSSKDSRTLDVSKDMGICGGTWGWLEIFGPPSIFEKHDWLKIMYIHRYIRAFLHVCSVVQQINKGLIESTWTVNPPPPRVPNATQRNKALRACWPLVSLKGLLVPPGSLT